MTDKLPAAAKGFSHADDIDVDVDVRTTDAPPADPAVETEGPITPRAPPPVARRRPKGLRIPDDEVARPITASPPEVAEGRVDSIRPSPIITINPPPKSEPSARARSNGGARDVPPPPPPPPPPDTEVLPMTSSDAPPDGSEPVAFQDKEGPTGPPRAALVAKKLPSVRPPQPSDSDGVDIPVDEDAPASDEPEISTDDMVSVESRPVAEKSPPSSAHRVPDPPPPSSSVAGPRRASVPPPPPVGFSSSPQLPDAPSPRGGVAVRQPLVVLPASPLAPPPMNETTISRKRARPWWEELFNDDFIRTMAKITDAQIAAEADFIEDSLGVAKAAMVLDLGCGTGRHAIELTRRGYQVVGFDLSLAMLARAADEAQERSQKLNFLQGDMREMTFEDTFDGVYSWNTSFGFFEEEKNAHVVTRVHKSLRKGGQFLLDVVNRDYILRQQPSLAWFEGDGCICMDEMQIDWITSRMRVKRTMMMDDGRSKEIEYSVRVYSLHELGKILHDHGFRVAEVSGRIATPGVFFGSDSPRTLILAEKR